MSTGPAPSFSFMAKPVDWVEQGKNERERETDSLTHILTHSFIHSLTPSYPPLLLPSISLTLLLLSLHPSYSLLPSLSLPLTLPPSAARTYNATLTQSFFRLLTVYICPCPCLCMCVCLLGIGLTTRRNQRRGSRKVRKEKGREKAIIKLSSILSFRNNDRLVD